MSFFYTGVGSRRTPSDVLRIMQQLAERLSERGYVLRSGGADGADSAFYMGCRKRSEIYRPEHANREAILFAARFHPAWHRCGAFARRLHGRNAFQVLGADLQTPSKFLVCWTPDGAICHAQRSIKTGGTGTAISIADHFNIPVFNLQRLEHRARIERFI